ncbi:unnamed protein product [Fraxinus pennsylvanica]|uniref:Uncharacterized protein n=1 Tax=Fraxinus pennsylvanica TaxID=56036 RepID=A0AAD1ZE93_9LAMI|nr:unnamed protein product [Fraxinus pennsylvanica]
MSWEKQKTTDSQRRSCAGAVRGLRYPVTKKRLKSVPNKRSRAPKVRVTVLCDCSDIEETTPELVVPPWLSYLPIKGDLIEAKLVHEQLCSIVERSDREILGPNIQYLPKIVAIFAEMNTGHYESIGPISFHNQIFEGPDTDIEIEELK